MEMVILTLFPRYFLSPLSESLLGKAQENNLLTIKVVDIRDFAGGKHRVVDDYPFGGGEGMVLKPEPIYRALLAVKNNSRKRGQVILLTPQGVLFNQNLAFKLAQEEQLIFICGHYEGIDERVAEYMVDLELSVGDYVLSGGEAAALIVVETIARCVPGVVGNSQSLERDSFTEGLLKWPVYTRPRKFRDWEVPAVLLEGNHRKINEWRRKESLRRTLKRRPDLLKKVNLSNSDRILLAQIEVEERNGGNNHECH